MKNIMYVIRMRIVYNPQNYFFDGLVAKFRQTAYGFYHIYF